MEIMSSGTAAAGGAWDVSAQSLVDEICQMLSLDAADLDARYGNAEKRQRLGARLERLCRSAFVEHAPEFEWAAHYALYKIYLTQTLLPTADSARPEGSSILAMVRNVLETSFIASETHDFDDLVASMPSSASAYVEWLKELIVGHRAMQHPLYTEYVPREATMEDLRHLLIQESTIDTATDDFLAQLQTGASGSVKMEMARNYWDEMGAGDIALLHSRLFSDVLVRVGVQPSTMESEFLCEALACGNVQLMLSLQRRHFHRGVGYFGVTEYMAPVRFSSVLQGLRRNGIASHPNAYYELHVHVDEDHSAGWFRRVIEPLATSGDRARREMTAGALLRLRTSERYLDRVLSSFPGRSSR